jgi:hypothetical protein
MTDNKMYVCKGSLRFWTMPHVVTLAYYTSAHGIHAALSACCARYVQVKRRNQSFCFLCDLSDTGLNVKELLVAATAQQPFTKRPVISCETIRLLRADTVTVLDDADVLSECEDMKKSFTSTGVAVLYVVTQRGTTATGDDSEWEAVDVVSNEQEQHQLMDETSAMTD